MVLNIWLVFQVSVFIISLPCDVILCILSLLSHLSWSMIWYVLVNVQCAQKNNMQLIVLLNTCFERQWERYDIYTIPPCPMIPTACPRLCWVNEPCSQELDTLVWDVGIPSSAFICCTNTSITCITVKKKYSLIISKLCLFLVIYYASVIEKELLKWAVVIVIFSSWPLSSDFLKR